MTGEFHQCFPQEAFTSKCERDRESVALVSHFLCLAVFLRECCQMRIGKNEGHLLYSLIICFIYILRLKICGMMEMECVVWQVAACRMHVQQHASVLYAEM